MSPDPDSEGSRNRRYALALAATAAGVIVALLLRPLIYPSVLAPFLLPVAVAALYGGIGPAVVASLLSAAALIYWFFPPFHALGIDASADVARLLVFLVVAAVITWMGGMVRNQRWKAMQAAAVLRANEEALRQVTSRVDVALSGSDIGIWELELPEGVLENGRVIFTNVWEQLGYGQPQAGPDFDSAINLSHPDDRERQKECFRAYLAGETPQLEFEHRLRHKNGSYRTVLVRGVAIREPGKLVRVIGSRVDITDRKRSEQALHVSEERFRLATEALGGFLWDWDPVSDQIECIGRTEDVLGFRADEIPREAAWWRNRIHPEDAAAAAQARAAVLNGERLNWVIEYRVQHRGGHYVDVANRGHAVRDAIGRVIRVVGGISDITERRRWEREREEAGKALRTSEERFRLASEALAAFLYERDPVTNHLEWFGGMEEVLGFRLDEVTPDIAWYESRMHPDDVAPTRQSARAALESGARGYTQVYRFRHRDGHYVHVADRSRIVRDEAGRATRVLGGVSDISERLRLETERAELLEKEREARSAAEAATRARDDVLGVVSHDLRNPLAAIGLCASALAQSVEPTSESARRILASIKQSAESTDRLIEDLLDVSSIQAGRLALEPHAEAPAAMVEQAADMFAATASAHGVALETRIAPHLPAIRADAERVVQGLANLITNSLKFTDPGGHITLRAEPDPYGVRFAVEDTGIGIAAEDLPHVFDRFWQKHREGGARGTGLGLAIVRGIVDAHGGQVKAESTPGQGSRFSFTIPSAKEPG
jgi:PAS domain S-box-containing protein